IHETEPYHRMRLTDRARDVLEGSHCVLRLSADEAPNAKKAARTAETPDRSRKSSASAGKAVSDDLYERLSDLRLQIAKEQSVPAFVVFSNATLYDMCAKLPRTSAQFLQVSGVGRHKLMLYGDRFMQAIAEYLSESAGR
nr:HRDC domain-containing protein [Clostridia bacterium]